MKASIKGVMATGQSLVEFALVFPILLVFMLGIVDGGRAIFAYNQMSQATRDVARVASVTCFQTAPRCDWTTPGMPVTEAIAKTVAGAQGPVVWLIECVDPASLTPATPAPYTTRSLSPADPDSCRVGDIVRVHATLSFNLLYGPVAADFGTVGVASTSDQEILQ